MGVYMQHPARHGANARWTWKCSGHNRPMVSPRSWGFRSYAEEAYEDHLQRHHTEERMMSTREQIAARIRELDMEIARLDAMPVEPVVADGEPSVIWFTKVFGDSKEYTYAAVRAGNGLWYTTGQHGPKGFEWTALVEWIGDGGKIWWAMEWEQLA